MAFIDLAFGKTDDDQIETSIFYRRTVPPGQIQPDIEAAESPNDVMIEPDAEMAPGHGLTERGEPASCRLLTGDNLLIDCAACVGKELTTLNERLGTEHRGLMHRVLEVVQDAGKDGITLLALQVSLRFGRNGIEAV